MKHRGSRSESPVRGCGCFGFGSRRLATTTSDARLSEKTMDPGTSQSLDEESHPTQKVSETTVTERGMHLQHHVPSQSTAQCASLLVPVPSCLCIFEMYVPVVRLILTLHTSFSGALIVRASCTVLSTGHKFLRKHMIGVLARTPSLHINLCWTSWQVDSSS